MNQLHFHFTSDFGHFKKGDIAFLASLPELSMDGVITYRTVLIDKKQETYLLPIGFTQGKFPIQKCPGCSETTK